MKKFILFFSFATFLASCNNDKGKTATADAKDSVTKSSVDLPYTASYSSSWSTDVSDADLKMVLMTYKDWNDGNLPGLENAIADSIAVDFGTGDHFNGKKADLMKIWKTYRDSLSSVTTDMEAWQKMYSTDKKESNIVTWYKEIDTFKNGKVDSAYYHDINRVKDGKIIWYSQYKRPAKK